MSDRDRKLESNFRPQFTYFVRTWVDPPNTAAVALSLSPPTLLVSGKAQERLQPRRRGD